MGIVFDPFVGVSLMMLYAEVPGACVVLVLVAYPRGEVHHSVHVTSIRRPGISEGDQSSGCSYITDKCP